MLPDLILSDHAAQRMEQRGFTIADIRTLLATGTVTKDKKVFRRLNAVAMLRGREAKLAYKVETPMRIVVVSIMWTDEEGED